ncbi:hypothetical protein [Streptococcus orisasini]|uniref:hypothetical protein n=1 Tax=Streptococcus orisasini TaxID=1080071 RepID=UPI00070BA583|nr:hypothetical protein [Streptococcus orisasini]
MKNEINGKELENIEIKFKENKIFLREKDSKKDYCFVKNGTKEYMVIALKRVEIVSIPHLLGNS